MAMILTGCGNNDFADLDAFIATEKNKPKGPIEPLPEIKVVDPFIFKPEGLRDPFAPLEQPEQVDGADGGAVTSGIKPDTNRPKEELEAFPLDNLRMVGTITMNAGLWGLVKSNEGTIYRVHVGN
jgi:type IV pilus assembly protein PilP